MARSGAEQRTHRRYDVSGVRGKLRADHDARVLNLSVDGLAVETASWLQVGKSYNLRIRGDGEDLELQGEVAWCHLVGNRRTADGAAPIYRAGLTFGDALTPKAQEILGFVRDSGLIEPTTRVFGRFRLRRERTVDVSFTHPFDVERISLAGMLVAADLLPEVGSRFVLEIETPHGTLAPTVEVRSVEPGKQSSAGAPAAHIGVAFEKLGDEDRGILERLIAEQIDDVQPAAADS